MASEWLEADLEIISRADQSGHYVHTEDMRTGDYSMNWMEQ